MRTHTIASTRLAPLLSLLALGALGLIACGGGDGEDSATEAKVSAATTTEATARPDTHDGGETLPALPGAGAGAQAGGQHMGIALRCQRLQQI